MGNDNAALNKDAIKDRLVEIISSMAESEKRDLLEVLEIIRASKPTERREHQRTLPESVTGILMQELVLKDCIKNISKRGAFIETAHCFSIGQKLTMAISIAGNDQPIQLNGTIVRADSDGVAVEFDKAVSEI